MLEKVLKTLSNELDEITLDKAKEFMELELSSGSFLSELDRFTSKLVDKENTIPIYDSGYKKWSLKVNN